MSEKAVITVKLVPKAAKNAVLGWEEDLFGEKTLKACVTAVPEKGKANKALIDLLAKHFDIPKRDFFIIRGEKSTVKVIEIQGVIAKYLKF